MRLHSFAHRGCIFLRRARQNYSEPESGEASRPRAFMAVSETAVVQRLSLSAAQFTLAICPSQDIESTRRTKSQPLTLLAGPWRLRSTPVVDFDQPDTGAVV